MPYYLAIAAIAISLLALGVALIRRRPRSAGSSHSTTARSGEDVRIRALETRIEALERLRLTFPESEARAEVAAERHPPGTEVEPPGSRGSAQVLAPQPPAEIFVEQPAVVAQSLAEPEPFSPDVVASLFRSWCSGGARPRTNGAIEVVHTAFAATESGGMDGGKRHVLRDADQLSEFVRFSPVGEASGLVFPNPDAHFTPVLAHVFPGLTRADYEQRSLLAELVPVTVRRRPDMQWELV